MDRKWIENGPIKTMTNFWLANDKIAIEFGHHVSLLREIIKFALIKILIINEGLVEGVRIVLSLRKKHFYAILKNLWKQF